MKTIFILLGSLMIFSSNTWAQQKNEDPAHAMDKIIEHQIEELEMTKAGKEKSTNVEFMKFFDDMIAEQEKDLKSMQDKRTKLFPDVNKAPSTKEKLSAFTKDLEDEFKKLETEMKSAFEKFNAKLHKEEITSLSPRVEIKEGDKGYKIQAEVPGMARDDIKVKVKEDEVIITGKRDEEVKKSTATSTSSEFHYGEYERKIHLDDKVDPKSLKVEYKDGIISVFIKKV